MKTILKYLLPDKIKHKSVKSGFYNSEEKKIYLSKYTSYLMRVCFCVYEGMVHLRAPEHGLCLLDLRLDQYFHKVFE